MERVKFIFLMLVSFGAGALCAVAGFWVFFWFRSLPTAFMEFYNHSGEPIFVESLEFDGDQLMKDEPLENHRYFSNIPSRNRPLVSISFRRGSDADPETQTFLLDHHEFRNCYFVATINETSVEFTDCE